MSPAKYQRLLLKVSGEMLAGEQGYGIQPSILERLAEDMSYPEEIRKMAREIAFQMRFQPVVSQ